MDDQKKIIFEFATKELRAEIGLFWQRSLFFWGFIAAAFVAYGVLIREESKDLALAVACFGFTCSVAWTLANRGSKYWQVVWEEKLRRVESDVLGSDVYFKQEENTDSSWWGASRYSVTRLTIALSDYTVVFWFGLAIYASPVGAIVSEWSCARFGVIFFTMIYVVAMLIGGRSRKRTSSN